MKYKNYTALISGNIFHSLLENDMTENTKFFFLILDWEGLNTTEWTASLLARQQRCHLLYGEQSNS